MSPPSADFRCDCSQPTFHDTKSPDRNCSHCGGSNNSILRTSSSTASLLSFDSVPVKYYDKRLRIIHAAIKGFTIGAGIKGGLALFSILARFRRRRSLSLVNCSIQPSLNLKTINLSNSRKLKTMPDFTNSTLVDKLVLRGCKSLLKVHPSIGQLTELSHLDLRGCGSLKELPETIGHLTKLCHLDLDKCMNLKRLPEAMKQLTAMGHLNLGGCCKLTRLPEQLGDMKCLKILDASETAINYLPDSIAHLKELVRLELGWCKKLRKLPEQIGNMESLEWLDASDTAIEELPDSIEQLTSLQKLNLNSCLKLRNFPSSICNLTSVTRLSLHQEGMNKINLPDLVKDMKLKILALKCSRFPLNLSFSTSEGLGIGYVSQIFSSNELYNLSMISNLQYLKLRNWTGILPELPLNLITLNILEYASVEALPDLPSLKQLQRVSIEGSISLQSLPPLPPHLKELDVQECPNLQDVPDLSNLKELERLRFSKCSNLKSLPPLPPRLKYLNVEECTNLQDVPDLSNLKELARMCFRKCSNLKSVSFSQSSLQAGGGRKFPSFKATIPNMEVAEWFSYKSSGNTLSFTIPPELGDNFLGVALWVVYECNYAKYSSSGWVTPVITFKTEHTKRSYYLSEVNMALGEEVQSKVECTRDHIIIKSGDRIDVSFQIGPNKDYAPMKVKMCGAHIFQKAHSTPC